MGNLSDLGLVSWVYEDPPSRESLWFEKLDGNELRYWTSQQMPKIYVICAVYLLFIWLGPLWMKNRKPFNLQTPLFIWNALLAIFSIVGAVRVVPEFFQVLLGPNGFHRSACVADGLNHPTSFWGFAFVVSKVFELGDTVFIVLRKKPLIFLHWYHHFTMAWATFYMFPEGEPFARWFGSLNYSVHSIMYTYYAMKALNIKISKRISMAVTSLQIGQFVLGLAVNAYTAYLLKTGQDCFRTSLSVNMAAVIGSSYLLLFMKMFYNSYIAETKTKKD